MAHIANDRHTTAESTLIIFAENHPTFRLRLKQIIASDAPTQTQMRPHLIPEQMKRICRTIGMGVAFAASSSTGLSAETKIGWIEPVQRQIEGWTVFVDPALLPEGEQEDEGTQVLGMLANHLERISILLPQPQLAKMRSCEIWIEHHHPELGSMQYHPSGDWLKGKGYDPRLERKVHIPRAVSLISREQMLKHPAVILHELAHAYHHQILGFDDPEVLQCYKAAMESGDYEKVMLYTGRTVRHYAATDHKEYFAEATEAYFYRNDFHPFVAAELREHDPRAFALMEKIWGKL